MGLWSPTLRKVREEWPTLGSWWRRLTAGSSPGFQPGWNDKGLGAFLVAGDGEVSCRTQGVERGLDLIVDF
jgi:hypothetical protein